MTKKEFKQIVMGAMKDLPIEEKDRLLLKMQNEWIPSIRKKLTEKYTRCNACKKYFLTRRFKRRVDKENHILTTYQDAGYGDDDRIGEVECLVTYEICPGCKNAKQVDFYRNRIIWEKTRWENERHYR